MNLSFQRRSALLAILSCVWIVSPTLLHAQSSKKQTPGSGEYSQLIPQHLLGLVHAFQVHDELKMTEEQVAGIERLFQKIDGFWFRARNLPADKQRAQIVTLENEVRKWASANLSSEQQKRLQQLEFQAQGIRMLLRPDLSRQLGITDEQQAEMASLAEVTDKAKAAFTKAQMKGESTEALQQAVSAASKAEHSQTKLSQEQLGKLAEAIGEPFDTAQLTRIYPMAPELIPVKDWINSSPLTLEQLRGKVVLLHFYAFQCHNCHANFEHYIRWHEEFGDDVVVLGIQTPETPRERIPSEVSEAAKERELAFPIMVDLESKNWGAWSNTMWPTVYVIDQNGYIRQWWQGELNWNGATGDQKIQEMVKALLQEKV